MRLNGFVALCILATSLLASADTLLKLSSGRTQNIGNCWAHAGAFMAETLYENSNANVGPETVATELGPDIQALTVYERLLNVYRTKQKFSAGPVGTEGGWPIEYFSVLQKHGLLVYKTLPINKSVGYVYPTSIILPSLKSDRQINFNDSVMTKLQNNLMTQNLTEDKAKELIKATMTQYLPNQKWVEEKTKWRGETIDRALLYKKIMRPELVPTNPQDSVLLMVVAKEDFTDMTEGFYKQDTINYVVVPTRENIKSLIRYSLDKGYPVSFETTDHAMTIIGYQSIDRDYSYAVANSQRDISWKKLEDYYFRLQSSSMFYNVIKSELNKYVPMGVMAAEPTLTSGKISLKF